MNINEIKKIEINILLETIFQRYGYDFRNYARASIERRVDHFFKKTNFQNIGEMIPKILYDESFFANFFYHIFITVTEMFRDPKFFMAIREKVLPYLKTYPFINIWHAGCATGEEAYSLAILLKEEGLYERATIYATDLNEIAIEKAKKGIYELDKVSQFAANYKNAGGKYSFSQYFSVQYDLAIIDQTLKKNITFARHNLVTDAVFGEMHLIFCRNVLIYFDKILQKKVLNLFNDSLINNSFLALGSKETLQFSNLKFNEIDKDWKIYQKKFS